MDIDYAKCLLDILIENSARILRAGYGLNYAESAFFSVVSLLKAHPKLKAYFLDQATYALSLDSPGCLDEGVLPEELLELVAHEMRWEEMKTLAEKRITDSFNGDYSLAVCDVSQRIINALSDDWPDREFYAHYHAG